MKVAAIHIVAALSVFIAFTSAARAAQKPTNDDCLACHGDSTLTKEVNGKPVSLYVSPDKFNSSIHEATPAKVNCSRCHADEQTVYDRSLHAKALAAGNTKAATCVDCHGSPHELLPARDPKSKVNNANIHSRAHTCHDSPHELLPAREPKSKVNHANCPSTCASCHG